MPKQREIVIVRKGNNVGPKVSPDTADGLRTRVQNGDTVTFIPQEGATDLTLAFIGPMPFAPGTQVAYKTPLKIDVATGAGSKVFKYLCGMKIGGQRFESKRPEDGGEIEITPD